MADMNKNSGKSLVLRKSIAAALALAFAFMCVVPVFAASNLRVARITAFTGTVTVQKSGGEKQFKAFKGMSLSEGDIVITAKNASATLEIDDDKEIILDENTRTTVSELAATSGSDGQKTGLGLWAGKMWVNIKKKLNVHSKFEVKTPTTVLGVRGTSFYISQQYGPSSKRIDPVSITYNATSQINQSITDIAVLDGTVSATQYVPAERAKGDAAKQSEVEVLVGKNQQVTLDQNIQSQKDVKVEPVTTESLDLFVLEAIKEDPEGIDQSILKNIDKVIEQKKEEKKEDEKKKEEEQKQQGNEGNNGTGTGSSVVLDQPVIPSYDDTVNTPAAPQTTAGAGGNTTTQPTGTTYAGPTLVSTQTSASTSPGTCAYIDGIDITQLPVGASVYLDIGAGEPAGFYIGAGEIENNGQFMDAVNNNGSINQVWTASIPVSGGPVKLTVKQPGYIGNSYKIWAVNHYNTPPMSGTITINNINGMPMGTIFNIFETSNPPQNPAVLMKAIKTTSGITPPSGEFYFDTPGELISIFGNPLLSHWSHTTYDTGQNNGSIQVNWYDSGNPSYSGYIDVIYLDKIASGGTEGPGSIVTLNFDKPVAPCTDPIELNPIATDGSGNYFNLSVISVGYTNDNKQVTLGIAKDMPPFTNIISLCLKDTSGNNVDMGYGVVHIADANFGSAIGKSLYMQYNGAYIDNDFPQVLLNGLIKLDARGDRGYGNDYVIQSIAGIEKLPNLQDVNLSDNYLGSGTELARLVSLTHLKRVNLSNNGISDSMLSGLTGLTWLEGLNLSKNNIANIASIPAFPALKDLGLGGNQFTSLEPLEKYASTLRSLDISNNTNFDPTCQTYGFPSMLSPMQCLEILDLTACRPVGAGTTFNSSLASTLDSCCPSLNWIVLSGNNIDANLYDWIKAKDDLVGLGIANIRVNNTPIADISFLDGNGSTINPFNNLVFLDISDNPIDMVYSLATNNKNAIMNRPNLNTLFMRNLSLCNGGYPLGGLSFILGTNPAVPTNLKVLDLSGDSITSTDISDVISKITSLEQLELRRNMIAGIAPFSTLSNLYYLGLGDNPIVDYTTMSNGSLFYRLIPFGIKDPWNVFVNDSKDPTRFGKRVWIKNPDNGSGNASYSISLGAKVDASTGSAVKITGNWITSNPTDITINNIAVEDNGSEYKITVTLNGSPANGYFNAGSSLYYDHIITYNGGTITLTTSAPLQLPQCNLH